MWGIHRRSTSAMRNASLAVGTKRCQTRSKAPQPCSAIGFQMFAFRRKSFRAFGPLTTAWQKGSRSEKEGKAPTSSENRENKTSTNRTPQPSRQPEKSILKKILRPPECPMPNQTSQPQTCPAARHRSGPRSCCAPFEKARVEERARRAQRKFFSLPET